MIKVYNCLSCGAENIKKPQNSGKYCNHACQREYEYNTITKPRIEEGLVITPTTLKKYVIKEYGEVCASCGLGSIWNGAQLSLQLDHIDGNSDNCKPDNIRLLCPNCHTQTDTFGSKGCGNRYKKSTKRNVYIRQYRGSEMGD